MTIRIVFVDDELNILEGTRRAFYRMRGEWSMDFPGAFNIRKSSKPLIPGISASSRIRSGADSRAAAHHSHG